MIALYRPKEARHAGRRRRADRRRARPGRGDRKVHGPLRPHGAPSRGVQRVRLQERDPADRDRPHRALAADRSRQGGRPLPGQARRRRLPRRLRVPGHSRQRRALEEGRRARRRSPRRRGVGASARSARALRRAAQTRAVPLSMQTFRFELGELPPEAETLRTEVREFLRRELDDAPPVQRAHSWGGFDREFSRKMGARGWIAMTWPTRYGGHERTALERYVVLEEMLAAGAPVSAHWIADRQSGPLLLRFGTEA